MVWGILIAIAIVGWIAFYILKDRKLTRDFEETRRQSNVAEKKTFQIAEHFIQEKPKILSTHIKSLPVDESRIEKKFSVLGSKLVHIDEWDHNDLIDVKESKQINSNALNWSGEAIVFLIDDGFIVSRFPHYELEINIHTGIGVDKNIEKYKNEITNLKIATTKYEFDDIVDITYSEEKITVNAGSSASSGSISGTTTSSTFNMSDGDVGASFSEGTFDGNIAMEGTQGGVAKELTTEASLKIFAKNKPDPIELKLTPIDMSDSFIVDELKRIPAKFITDAHKNEAEVAKLKTLFQAMTAHMKRKETLQNGQKKRLESEKYASSKLSDDAYKIFLTNEFEIQKNDVLEKFIVNEKLFDTVEEALKHADGLYRNSNN